MPSLCTRTRSHQTWRPSRRRRERSAGRHGIAWRFWMLFVGSKAVWGTLYLRWFVSKSVSATHKRDSPLSSFGTALSTCPTCPLDNEYLYQPYGATPASPLPPLVRNTVAGSFSAKRTLWHTGAVPRRPPPPSQPTHWQQHWLWPLHHAEKKGEMRSPFLSFLSALTPAATSVSSRPSIGCRRSITGAR